MLLLLSIPLAVDGAAVNRDQWEWKLAGGIKGTVMMRPSSNHTWGTVCADGMTSYFVSRAVCTAVGLVHTHGGYVGAVSTVSPGPESAPRYLANANCMYQSTNLDDCTWGAGDPLVVGEGLPPSDCTHQEDLGVECKPSINELEMRLVPLVGTTPADRTGAIEARVAPGQPWGRVVVDPAKVQIDEEEGVMISLCRKIYPGDNFTFDDVILLPWVGVGSVSSLTTANPNIAFRLDDIYVDYASYTYLPIITSNLVDMKLSCGAKVAVRLVDNTTTYSGVVETSLVVPGVPGIPWSKVCTPTYAVYQSFISTAVCTTLFGSSFASLRLGQIPRPDDGRGAVAFTHYQSDGSYYSTYKTLPDIRHVYRVGAMAPSMYRGAYTTCEYVINVTCQDVHATLFSLSLDVTTSGVGFKAGYLTARMRGGLTQRSCGVYIDSIPLTTRVSICESVGQNDAIAMPGRANATLDEMAPVDLFAAMACRKYVDGRYSLLENCTQLNPTMCYIQQPINCTNTSLLNKQFPSSPLGYENASTYEYRLDNANYSSPDYVSGTLQMRGNGDLPWKLPCFGAQATSESLTQIICQTLFPGMSFYGTKSEGTRPPLATGGEESPMSGVTIRTCPHGVSFNDTMSTCYFDLTGAMCETVINMTLRCNFFKPLFRLSPLSALDNTTGVLQINDLRSSVSLWGRVQRVANGFEEAACQLVGFPSRLGEVAKQYYVTNYDPTQYGSAFTSLLSCRDASDQRSCIWAPQYADSLWGYTVLMCRQPYFPSSGNAVRLVDGPNVTSGAIEMRLASHLPWNSVCSDSINVMMACQYLFGDGMVVAAPKAVYPAKLDADQGQVVATSCPYFNAALEYCNATVLPSTLTTTHCARQGVVCQLAVYEAQLASGERNSTGVLLLRQSPTAVWTPVCSSNFKKDQRLWYAACSLAGFPPSAVEGKKPHYTFRGATSLPASTASSSIVLSTQCLAALSAWTPTNNTVMENCLDVSPDMYCSSTLDVVLDCDPPPTATQTTSLQTTSVSQSPRTASITHSTTQTTTHSLSKSLRTLCGGLPLLLLGGTKSGTLPALFTTPPVPLDPTNTEGALTLLQMGEAAAQNSIVLDTLLLTPPRTCQSDSTTFDFTYMRWSSLADPTRVLDTQLDGEAPLYQDLNILLSWGLQVPTGGYIQSVGEPVARGGDDVVVGGPLTVSRFKVTPIIASGKVQSRLYNMYSNSSSSQSSSTTIGLLRHVGVGVSFRISYKERAVMYSNTTAEFRVRVSPIAAAAFDLPSSQDVTIRMILLPPPVPSTRTTVTAVLAATGGAVVGGGALVAPGVALQQGVAFALLRMTSCTEPDYETPDKDVKALPMIVHPLLFPLGQGFFKYHRGAVLSNTILLPALFALISRFPVVAATQLLNRKIGEDGSADHALAIVGWPSIAILPYIAVVEGSMSASVTLLYGEGGNIVMGIMGLVVVVAITSSWIYGLVRLVPRADIALHKTVFANQLDKHIKKSTSVRLVFGLLRFWGPWYEWGPKLTTDVQYDADNKGGADVDLIEMEEPLHAEKQHQERKRAAEARTVVFREIERTSHFIGDRWLIWAEILTYGTGLFVGLLEGLPVSNKAGCRVRAVIALLLTVAQALALLITTVPVDFICALITGLLSLVIASAATAVTFSPGNDAASTVLDAAATAGVVIGIVGVISMSSAFLRFVISFAHRIYYRRREMIRAGIIITVDNEDGDSDDNGTMSDINFLRSPDRSPPPSIGGSMVGVPHRRDLQVQLQPEGSLNGNNRRQLATADVGFLLTVPATPLTQSFVSMNSDEEKIVRTVVKRVDEYHREREGAATSPVVSRTASNNSTSSIDRFLYYEDVPKNAAK